MNRADKSIILKAEGLTKTFKRPGSSFINNRPDFTAVDNVSFDMKEGELLGLLGESGCGKSTLARMLMHLTKPDKGKIFLDGEEVQDEKESAFRKKRHLIQMVFQNPFDCLDPVRHVKSLLEEPLKLWKPKMDPSERLKKIHEVIGECGLPDNCLDKLPREFSGGQLQRISIARALLIEPKVLIADEIVSALDVSVQNQILNLLLKMKEMHDLSILFITHDLSVAKKVSDRVMVMREGVIKGIGVPEEVFAANTDPYIRELASAVFTFSGRTCSAGE